MPNAINQRIVTLCKEKGYSWYRLSAISGIPVSTIVSIINRNNAPTIPTLQKLCDALGLTLSQFFSEGFDTTTGTQDTYLFEFSRLSNHEQELVLAYIRGMLDAKDIQLEQQARVDAEKAARASTRKKPGRKKKVKEPAGAESENASAAAKVSEGEEALKTAKVSEGEKASTTAEIS